MIARTHDQGEGVHRKGRGAARVREVVATLTLKVAGTVELTDVLAGTTQLASLGAPVQLNDAVPPMP